MTSAPPAKRNRSELSDDVVRQAHEEIACRIRTADFPVGLTNAMGGDAIQQALQQLPNGHGPNASSSTEWWYANGHVPQLEVSFFAALFRLCPSEQRALDQADRGPFEDTEIPRGYALTWALIDSVTKEYTYESIVDAGAVDYLKYVLETDRIPVAIDTFVRRSLLETLGEGAVPAPDIVVPPAKVTVDSSSKVMHVAMSDGGKREYAVTVDGRSNTFRFNLRGASVCSVGSADGRPIQLDVTLTPQKNPILHGRDGFVNLIDGDEPNTMKYVVYPRCSVNGSLRRARDTEGPVPLPGPTEEGAGVAWVDHEWGGCIARSPAEAQAILRTPARRQNSDLRWEWAAVTLSNDVEVSLTKLWMGKDAVQVFAVVREGTAPAFRVDGITFEHESGQTWTSAATGAVYPTTLTAVVPFRDGASASIRLSASTFPDQECISLWQNPSFWEGHAAVVSGSTWRGANVTGHAFIEVLPEVATAETANAVYALLKAMIVDPAHVAIQAAVGDADSAAIGMEVSVAVALEAVNNACPLLELQSKEKLTESNKLAMAQAIAAAYETTKAPSRRQETERWLSAQWAAVKSDIPNDRKRLMLRAWQLRLLDETFPAETKPEENIVQQRQQGNNNNTNTPAAEYTYVVPTSELKPPTPAELAAGQQHLSGVHRMLKKVSDPLNPMLTAQGVNIVVRQLTDRLEPTITLSVSADAVATVLVKTVVSNNEFIVPLGGDSFKWFSSGRGDLTSKATLQDGGKTLYQVTAIPPEHPTAVEHKWMRFGEGLTLPDKETEATVIEHYRYDPDGMENDKSISATRYFVAKS